MFGWWILGYVENLKYSNSVSNSHTVSTVYKLDVLTQKMNATLNNAIMMYPMTYDTVFISCDATSHLVGSSGTISD